MKKEQLYEIIEAYLEGELQEDARRAFERQMADDPEIEAEVRLHRRLHQELGKSGKAALRQQLRQIAREFPIEQGGRRARVYRLMTVWGAVAAAVIVAVIWWAWPRSSPSSGLQGPVVAVDSLPGAQTGVPDSQVAVEPPPKPEEALPATEPPSTAPPPSADPFLPNPELESLAATDSRDPSFLISAEAGATPTPTDRFRATVAGTLRSVSPTEGEPLQLYVYGNEPGAYQQERPAARLPIELNRMDDDEVQGFGRMNNYTFETEVEKELPPGLYYYVIKREGDGQPLFVGKVEVGEKK